MITLITHNKTGSYYDHEPIMENHSRSLNGKLLDLHISKNGFRFVFSRWHYIYNIFTSLQRQKYKE